MTTMTEATTRTLEVPGATLTYDVRPNASSTEPPLFLIGSPMGAAGFGTLAGHFPDRTVITYDLRGADRSTKPDLTSPSVPGRTRRRPSSDHPGGWRAGRPVRQQRWCGECACVGREASGGRSDPGGARASARHRAARSRERAGSRPRRSRHVHAQRLRCRHGPLHRHRQPSGRVPRRHRAAAGARPGHVRDADGG